MRERSATAWSLALLVLCAFVGCASDAVAGDARQPGEVAAIRQQLMATWSSAQSPLTVEPVVVAGDHAVADWTQPQAGGRALLFRHKDQWHVVLCAGDALKDAKQLESAGVPTKLARQLASKLARAEKAVTAERLARMASFNGIVRMDAHEPSGHTQ